jgi:mannose-6-phosphate isomerase class I
MRLETEARAIESFCRRPRVLRLECGVQHYDWGDPDAIPAILGRPNPEGRPFAELWAGAHPDLPSLGIVDGVRVPLDLLMRDAAREILGPSIAPRFHGELPFLMKILAAGSPLSIQAHPNRAQALLGFERENLEGLPREAATRNYRDKRHKPELLVALGDFYALCGFRPPAEIAQTLAETPELAPLTGCTVQNADDLAALYRHIMHLDQPGVSALLDPLVERLEHEARRRPFTQEDRNYWLLHAHRAFSTPGRAERGLLSMLLLNLVHLRAGQAIFLSAGELHAYLRGTGIEIMANSNNVLRGGLTTKHVDPEELLKVLSFRGAPVEVLEAEAKPEEPRLIQYRTPAAEFALSRLALEPGDRYVFARGEMRFALIADGALDVAADDRTHLHLKRGEALLVPAGLGCRAAATEGAELWLVRVPDPVSRTR